MTTASKIISIAEADVGYSRWNDPQNGTKYGRWYADKIGDKSFAANGVPHCAMAVSMWFDQAGVKCAGLPAAYCPYILRDAKAAGAFVTAKELEPGYPVIFDWENDGVADHIGVVKSNNKSTQEVSIEANVSNGQTLVCTRSYNYIVGGIKPSFAGGSSSSSGGSSSGSGNSTPSGDGLLNVDGLWGFETTKRFQKILGTAADGIVSNQWAAYKSIAPSCLDSTFNWKANPGSSYSPMIKAMQKILGVKQDGWLGPATIKALQKRLGVTADGVIGPNTVKALQKRLNTGKF